MGINLQEMQQTAYKQLAAEREEAQRANHLTPHEIANATPDTQLPGLLRRLKQDRGHNGNHGIESGSHQEQGIIDQNRSESSAGRRPLTQEEYDNGFTTGGSAPDWRHE